MSELVTRVIDHGAVSPPRAEDAADVATDLAASASINGPPRQTFASPRTAILPAGGNAWRGSATRRSFKLRTVFPTEARFLDLR